MCRLRTVGNHGNYYRQKHSSWLLNSDFTYFFISEKIHAKVVMVIPVPKTCLHIVSSYTLAEVSFCISVAWWVSPLVDYGSPRAHVASLTSIDWKTVWRASKFLLSKKLNQMCNFDGLLHQSPSILTASCFGIILASFFNVFCNTLLGQGSLLTIQYPKHAYGRYCEFNQILKWGV